MNTFFNKIFPHPILSLALWGVWLLLNNTVGAGHIVLGLILAILIPFLTSGFWPEKNRIQAASRQLFSDEPIGRESVRAGRSGP